MPKIDQFGFLMALSVALLTGITGQSLAESQWQRSFGEVQELGYREADQRIPYGTGDAQFIDLWLPPDNKTAVPVVVLIHGGCWLAHYDISHVRPLATAIADEGFAVWAVEYRRVDQPGGGWPGTFLDVAHAVDLLMEHGHPALDKSRVVFVGHSAGGHLALWAAGRSRLNEGQELHRDNPARPVSAVGLAAITDLAAYATGDNNCQKVVPRLMGGMPHQVPGRYAQASPAVLGSDVPLILVQGNADPIVPPAQAGALPEATRHILDDAGHFDLIHTGTPAFPELVGILRDVAAR